MPAPPDADTLSDADYQRRTDAVLAAVEATVDRWLQQDVIDIDPQRTGGLLELEFPAGGRIVINTQPPLQELWLASPAQAHHFRCCGGAWLDTKGAGEFFEILSAESSQLAGKSLRFSKPT